MAKSVGRPGKLELDRKNHFVYNGFIVNQERLLMNKFLLALIAVAALTAGCDDPQAQQRYNSTWYEVTKFVGDKPVERWYVHTASYNRFDTTCYIEFHNNMTELGDNVKVRNVSDTYTGPEKHEILEGYTE